MTNYFLFALRSDSNLDYKTIYEKNFSSYTLSLDMFHSLVGRCIDLVTFPNSAVTSYDDADSPYIRKIRISSGDVLIYVYLQKLS